MVLCLTLVCLFCSAVLGFVNYVTEAPIAEASRKALQDALSLVLPENGEISTEASTVEIDGNVYEYYVQRADSLENWAVKSTVNGFGGA
ncbi:MAG: RnfABCDGE type electron transport complex subunit G, partial [Bacteroidales bacterium]|nr:RnfABCDGE type electron transport complex subunit G [Bacteroidales bacterium]